MHGIPTMIYENSRVDPITGVAIHGVKLNEISNLLPGPKQ